MDIPLKCDCGRVTGVAENVSGALGNRIVCYCGSCQKFARHVGRAEDVLDEYGGTDIFQMPISHFKLTSGADQVRCVHVTEGGLHRWYADCCKTLIGNTGGPAVPFIGMIHSFMDDEGVRDRNLGPIRAHVFPDGALQPLPADTRSSMFPVIVSFLWRLLTWKLQGKNKPNPLFDDKGHPISKGVTLSYQ